MNFPPASSILSGSCCIFQKMEVGRKRANSFSSGDVHNSSVPLERVDKVEVVCVLLAFGHGPDEGDLLHWTFSIDDLESHVAGLVWFLSLLPRGFSPLVLAWGCEVSDREPCAGDTSIVQCYCLARPHPPLLFVFRQTLSTKGK